MRPLTSADRPGTSRRAGLVLAGTLAVLAGLYVIAYVVAGAGIARGTTVLGVPIGGQAREEATRTLERELRGEATAAIPVRAGGAESTVDPAAAGLTLDAAATVDAAPARSWDPVALARSSFDALFGDNTVTPVTAVDRDLLVAQVGVLAESVDQEAVEGGVTVTGVTVEVVDPQPGLAVDRAGAVAALASAYLAHDYVRESGRVEIPTEVDRPDVDRAEVDRVVSEVAEPAVAGPVLVTVEGTTVEIPARAVGRSLTFEPDGAGTLSAVLSAERLHAAVTDGLAAVEDPARDATFRIRNGRPRVVPSQQGREVLPETLAAAVLPVLSATGTERTVTVPLEVSEPEISTEMARSLGVTEQVATYTTYYPSDFAPRLTNIHRAADLLDGTLVLPGKVFSFNDTVGERTAARGFAAGFIINNGQLEVDYGGGVSQLVTTTFNSFFFAGLEIIEHNPHSFYISRYPEGRESTIAWGYKDLRVRNDSEQGIFITTGYTNSSVTVTVWGTKRYSIEATKSARYDLTPFRVVYDLRTPGVDRGDCVATQGVSGFRVIVNRLFYKGGQQIRSEEFRTRYEPEPEVICGKSGPPEPEPDPDPDPDPDPSESASPQ